MNPVRHVTFVMAVYNGRISISATIDSILSQTWSDWDLLVIDDASTDETSEQLQSFASRDPRIAVLRTPTNLGLATCLNLGWHKAQGDMIARIDADDLCMPVRLEHQVEFMLAHPEVSVLGTAAELVDEQGRPLGVAFRPEHHRELAARIYKENPFIHPSVIVRRRFFEVVGGYDEKLRRSQDYDLWLRGYRHFQYGNLQEPLIRYRVRRKQPWNQMFIGSFVSGRSAWREGLFLTHGWYALRYFVAVLLTNMGLYESRLR